MTRQRCAEYRMVPVLVAALILSSTSPAQGQFQNVLSTLFGTSSSPAPPASPTIISSTTPTTTPTATPAATTAAAAAPTTPATPAASTTPTKAAAAPVTAAANPAAAASPIATTLAPVAAPVQAPAKKATPSPPPPAPIVVDQSKLVPALPSDETIQAPSLAPAASSPAGITSDETAVDVVLQVSGSGVTPFVIPQQTVLLRAMASVLTTVSMRDLRIRYVTSAASSRRRLLEDESVKSRRSLLADAPAAAQAAAASGQLYNVASVTLEANCSSSAAVPATLNEMRTVVSNNLLASAIQTFGESGWGVTLLSLTAVNPNVALTGGPTCKKPFGAFCLDGTSLSVATVEIIIAIGAIFVLALFIVPCVYLEWRRKSGVMAELEPAPQTPRTPLDRMQQMYNQLINSVKAASPLHRRGTSNGHNAFGGDTPTSAKSDKAPGGIVQLTATQA